MNRTDKRWLHPAAHLCMHGYYGRKKYRLYDAAYSPEAIERIVQGTFERELSKARTDQERSEIEHWIENDIAPDDKP